MLGVLFEALALLMWLVILWKSHVCFDEAQEVNPPKIRGSQQNDVHIWRFKYSIASVYGTAGSHLFDSKWCLLFCLASQAAQTSPVPGAFFESGFTFAPHDSAASSLPQNAHYLPLADNIRDTCVLHILQVCLLLYC